MLAVIVKNEKKKLFKINFYIKISKNLDGNFLDIWQFLETFWHSREQVFNIIRACNRDSLPLRSVVSPGRTLRCKGREVIMTTDTQTQTQTHMTDIFVIICVDFQEALSLLVYRDLWYMDAQVCFLRVLFKSWINHFFHNSTEISSDGHLKALITFRLTTFLILDRICWREIYESFVFPPRNLGQDASS